MSKKLYIIGNGFDLWHGLPTSYRCFNCYMHREHQKDHERIGHIFNRMNPNMLWSDYENKLWQVDIVELVKKNIETWANSSSVYDIENDFDTLYDEIKSYFHKWILQIDYSLENKRRLEIDDQSLFLNFNYTNTLERFYEIRREQICYIHGDTGNNSLYSPVIGHGKSSIECIVCSMKERICQCTTNHNIFPKWASNPDTFTQEIIKIVSDFLKDLKKNTEYYIDENEKWFEQLDDVNDIYVLGHSLAMVDSPYFLEILKRSLGATWHISYQNECEKKVREENLIKLLNVQEDVLNVVFFTFDEMMMKNESDILPVS